MNASRTVAVLLLIAASGVGYLAWQVWQAGDDSKWLFLLFAVFLMALGVVPLVPEFKRQPKPESLSTRFAPHWLLMLVVPVMVVVVVVVIFLAVRGH